MLKVAFAVVFAISSNIAQAWSDGYYECTKPDGSLEYSLFRCEAGQEQRHVGGEEAPQTRSPAKEAKRSARPMVPQTAPRPSLEGKLNPGLNLASYKCVGKSGDILYTDASDYLAFEVYRCTQVTRNDACTESRDLLAKDPLAVISNKLQCP